MTHFKDSLLNKHHSFTLLMSASFGINSSKQLYASLVLFSSTDSIVIFTVYALKTKLLIQHFYKKRYLYPSAYLGYDPKHTFGNLLTSESRVPAI